MRALLASSLVSTDYLMEISYHHLYDVDIFLVNIKKFFFFLLFLHLFHFPVWKRQAYSNKSEAAHPIDVARGCPPIVWRIPASAHTTRWSWWLQLFPISSRECNRKGRDGTAVHMPAGNRWLRIISHKWCLSLSSWRQGAAVRFELHSRAKFY